MAWEFFAYDGGIVEAARVDGGWRVRRSGQEVTERQLDTALERLLGLNNFAIARLAVQILQWQNGGRPDEGEVDEEFDAGVAGLKPQVRREVASLRRLLRQEEAVGRHTSAVARAARELLAERLGTPLPENTS